VVPFLARQSDGILFRRFEPKIPNEMSPENCGREKLGFSASFCSNGRMGPVWPPFGGITFVFWLKIIVFLPRRVEKSPPPFFPPVQFFRRKQARVKRGGERVEAGTIFRAPLGQSFSLANAPAGMKLGSFFPRCPPPLPQTWGSGEERKKKFFCSMKKWSPKKSPPAKAPPGKKEAKTCFPPCNPHKPCGAARR